MKKTLPILFFALLPFWAAQAQDEPGAIIDYNASITVPKGDKVSVGLKGTKHYVAFTAQAPVEVIDGENTTTYHYNLANSSNYNYKVVSTESTVADFANHVSYASKFTISASAQLDIDLTGDDANGNPYLNVQGGEVKSYINTDLSANSGYNVSDIYLNGTYTGHVALAKEETFQIVNLRTWQITDNTTNNYFLEPDYHYVVVDENGNESDGVITVSENGLVTAVGEGTALVLVSYDAIKTPNQLGGADIFSALWPENTGVLVFTVGGAETGIEPNITVHPDLNTTDTYKLSAGNADSEHDVFYYLESEDGFKLTFTPENVTSVALANPEIGVQTASYSGFEAVEKNADGSYTLLLKNGRNIVKLSNANGSIYYVLRAKPLSYTITNNTSSKFVGTYSEGDNVTVRFNTVYHPANKLAGIYNFSARIDYTNGETTISSTANQYQFAKTEKAQSLTFTISGAEDGNFVLSNGRIYITYYGSPIGAHREISYETGASPNFDADLQKAYFAVLPDIVIPVTTVTEKQIAAAGDIVLNLAEAVNANDQSAVAYNESGYWTKCYDEDDLDKVNAQIFDFAHFAGWGGTFYSGYVPSVSGDTKNYGAEGSSSSWIDNQWGCMAGGGIPMTADGLSVYTDQHGTVLAEQGAPYFVMYGSSDKAVANGTALISMSKEVTAKGVYVAMHPWPYYGILNGDGYSQPFANEGDYFELTAHGYKGDTETATVSFMLAKYENGSVTMSKNWEWFDLSGLGVVDKIDFSFDGSDYLDYGPGMIWLNTAVYVCMDRLVVTPASASAAVDETVANGSLAYRVNATLHNVPEHSDVYVFDVTGRLACKLSNVQGSVQLPVTPRHMVIRIIAPEGAQTLR